MSQRARCSNAPEPPDAAGRLRRIQVKLRAFLDPPATTLAAFPESDNSALARYARAIAYYRQPDLARALPAIDGLIRDFPDNPYYRELKGQMLFENGRVREAIRPYEDAVRLAPAAALLRISLSQVYIESGDPALNKRAIAYLNDASRDEGRDGQVWRLLATAYGRDNQLGMAALSLAEEALADAQQKDRDPAGDAGAAAVAAQHAVLSARRGHPARGGQARGLTKSAQGRAAWPKCPSLTLSQAALRESVGASLGLSVAASVDDVRCRREAAGAPRMSPPISPNLSASVGFLGAVFGSDKNLWLKFNEFRQFRQ